MSRRDLLTPGERAPHPDAFALHETNGPRRSRKASGAVRPKLPEERMSPALAARFGDLVDQHRATLLSHAFRLTRDRDEAEDLTQKSILRAARAFAGFDGDNFRAWTLTIVTNLHLNECKRLARTPTAPLEGEDEAASRTPSPLDLVSDRDVSPEILEAIGELPPAIGRTFLLAEFAGLTHNEAAAAEGIPVGTVRSRLFRARAFLRERLADYAREEYGVA